MGGGGGKGGGDAESTTEASSAPWSAQQPYLKQVFSEAQKLYENGGLAGDYYKGSTVADESNLTTQARQMIADRATNGDSNIDDAASSINNTVKDTSQSGNTGLQTLNQYAQNSNPYIDKMYQSAAQSTNNAINSNFSSNGRYGSGAQANAIASADEDLANEMYSNAYNQGITAATSSANAYNTGVSNLNSAATTAQTLGNQAYTDANNLATAGSSLDDYNQSIVDADVDRWNYNQQKDMTALQNYLNLVGGSYGGEATSTTSTDSGGSKGGK